MISSRLSVLCISLALLLWMNGVAGAMPDTFSHEFSTASYGAGRPVGITLGPNGNLFVSLTSGKVYEFDQMGVYQNNYFDTGFGGHAQGIAYDYATGNLFVANSSSNEYEAGVYRFDANNGTNLGRAYLAKRYSRDEDGVAVAYDGNIWVADQSDMKIYEYDRNATVDDTAIRSFDTAAVGITRPKGITFGSNGNLYISDDENGTSSIYEVTPDGVFVGSFETAPYGLLDPEGLAYASGPSGGGTLYIASHDSQKVVVVTNATAPAAVPEPSTILLLGSGMAGLGFFSRRRKAA